MAAATTPPPSRTPRSTTASSPSGAPRRSPRSGCPAAYDTGSSQPARAALGAARSSRRPLPQPPAYGYPQRAAARPAAAGARRRTSRSRPPRRAATRAAAAAAASGGARLGTGYEAMRPAAPRPAPAPARLRGPVQQPAVPRVLIPLAGLSVPPGTMASWGMRSCCRSTSIRSRRSGVWHPGRPRWSPGGWPETALGAGRRRGKGRHTTPAAAPGAGRRRAAARRRRRSVRARHGAADRRRSPSRRAPSTLEIFGDKVEGVPAADAAAHAWCSDYLGADVRLVHIDDPATPPPGRPGVRAARRDGHLRRRLSAAARPPRPRSTPSTR